MKIYIFLIIVGFFQVHKCYSTLSNKYKTKQNYEAVDKNVILETLLGQKTCLPEFNFSSVFLTEDLGFERKYILNICKKRFYGDNHDQYKKCEDYLFSDQWFQVIPYAINALARSEENLKTYQTMVYEQAADCIKCRFSISVVNSVGYFMDILMGDEFCENSNVNVNSEKCVDEVKDLIPRVVDLFRILAQETDRDNFCKQFCGSP